MNLFDLSPYVDGERDHHGVMWCRSTHDEVNALLRTEHYLGPRESGKYVFAGIKDGDVVAAQIWGFPSSRNLPSDGSWLELARWCLTPEAGKNAGSRQHARVVKWLRKNAPHVTTLVSYSDPDQGHTGALYRACNWQWRPTWHRLAPPPSGNGRWSADSDPQGVKDRWVFHVHPDPQRDEVLALPEYAERSLRIAKERGLLPWQERALSSISLKEATQ